MIKLNSQAEEQQLLIQFKEKMEYDLDISLKGMHDAFHVKGNEWTIFPESKGVFPYKQHLNASQIYVECTHKLSKRADQSKTK